MRPSLPQVELPRPAPKPVLGLESIEKSQSSQETSREGSNTSVAFFPYQDDLCALKFPDLVIQLRHPKENVFWAIELERTRKEKTRYYEMIQSYAGTSKINAVLVIAATESIEKNIQWAMNRLSYPQAKRPILFARYGESLAAPDSAELRMGDKRSSIAMAVQRWHRQMTNEPRNTVGNNVA